MKRLNGMDAMLLYTEAANLHTHTLKIAIIDASDFDSEFSFDLFRRTLRRRLPLLDPLRYQLVDIPWRLHHPMWLENCEVDLDYHLHRVQVPAPGCRREFDRLVGEIASTPLDRNHPLWEFHFAEGLAGDRFALIGKIHHALADGVASSNLVARLMDENGSDEAGSQPASCALPSTAQLVRAAARDHVHQIAALPGVFGDAVTGVRRLRRRARERGEQPDVADWMQAPPTFINHVLSPARTFATATLSLAQVKETSKRLEITINDLVLATSAGALRELLLCYDGQADQPIVASVPASIDKSPDRISGNELCGMVVSLPTHIDDTLERVRLTAVGSAIAKENNELLGPELTGRMIDYLPPAAAPATLRRLAKRQAQNKLFNVPISNVPGPRQRGHFAGARISEIYSVGPLMAACGINFTVWSYVDQLNISVIADDRTLDDPHEATDAMVSAFHDIRTAAGFLGELEHVESAMQPATI